VIEARTDVVGSLLRPGELLEARERQERGEIGPSEFQRVEDAAVETAIRLQEDAGLAVVTDGEMRRLSFQSQFTEAVEGFSDWDLDAFLWGDWHGDEVGAQRINRPPIAVLNRLRRRRFLSAEEFVYARGQSERIVKVTLPSPSLFANFYDPERSRGAYPTLESFLGDVAEILREEVDELVRLGCEYIQLDAPHGVDGRSLVHPRVSRVLVTVGIEGDGHGALLTDRRTVPHAVPLDRVQRRHRTRAPQPRIATSGGCEPAAGCCRSQAPQLNSSAAQPAFNSTAV